jgi:hypothetical protein
VRSWEGFGAERLEIDAVVGKNGSFNALQLHDGFVEIGLRLQFLTAGLLELDLTLQH